MREKYLKNVVLYLKNVVFMVHYKIILLKKCNLKQKSSKKGENNGRI